MKRFPLYILIGLCTVSLVQLGCTDEGTTATDGDGHDGHGEEGDHGHGEDGHEHPENLADAVAQIATMSTSIKDAFKEDPDGGTAHDDLHEIAHLLDDAKALAEKDESLSDDVKTNVIESVDTLFNAFNDVDEGMHHDDKGAKYPDVAEKIDAAVAALQAAVK